MWMKLIEEYMNAEDNWYVWSLVHATNSYNSVRKKQEYREILKFIIRKIQLKQWNITLLQYIG